MANSKTTTVWESLLSVELYKRTQGRLTRQLTAVALALIVFFGAWTLSQGPLASYPSGIRLGIPAAICLLAAWAIFRIVNYPRFADFLISVEAEMDKVSWADRTELYRGTIVVLVVMFLLGFVLLGYDLFWQWFFTKIGFLQL